MNEQQRAQLISEIHTHHLGLGDDVKRMVNRLLEPSLPTPWMYVFELTQNARDAGARRVSWTMANGALVLQHDGTEVLEERHIRGLCAIRQSTKGAGAVGFMGVGFKSVFGRFGPVGVTDDRWQIRFTVEGAKNPYGKRVTDWFGALLPRVDSTLAPPDPGFTTRFELDQPLNRAGVLLDDLTKLVSIEDLTPLAVLALRGLEQIRVGKDLWNCRFDGDLVEVLRCTPQCAPCCARGGKSASAVVCGRARTA